MEDGCDRRWERKKGCDMARWEREKKVNNLFSFGTTLLMYKSNFYVKIK